MQTPTSENGHPGLVGQLDQGLELYDRLLGIQRYGEDAIKLTTCLEMERCRFQDFRGGLETLDADTGRCRKTGTTDVRLRAGLIEELLRMMLRGLADVADRLDRRQSPTTLKSRSTSFSTVTSIPWSRLLPRSTVVEAWTGPNKMRFEALITDVRSLNNHLEVLAPPAAGRRMRLVAESVATDDRYALQRIEELCRGGVHPDVGQATAVKLGFLAMKMGPIPGQLVILQDCHLPISRIEYLDTSISNTTSRAAERERLSATLHFDDKSSNSSQTKSVFVEWRSAFPSNKPLRDVKLLLDQLVQMLRQMHTPRGTGHSLDFGSPYCLGWTTPDPTQFGEIGLVFEYPPDCENEPVSLFSRLSRRVPGIQEQMPSLSDRFALAARLSRIYGSLLAAGCPHRASCSKNILLFDERDISSAYLGGFTTGQADGALEEERFLELYWPFEKPTHGDGRRPSQGPLYGVETDLYALGMILLEIGLWRTAQRIRGSASLREFHEVLVPDAVGKLDYRTGNIYQGAVRKCLELGQMGEAKRDMCDVYTTEVLEQLSRCCA